MTANGPVRPTITSLTGQDTGAHRGGSGKRRPDRGPSPHEGARLRRLSRSQLQDRVGELGALAAGFCGGSPRTCDEAREAFLRRLADGVRRPGFELVIAETTALAGCAHGYPVRRGTPRWEGFDGYVPAELHRLAASGHLFAVSEILVPSRTRTRNQHRAWNLARRLQRRLLTDHGATAGVTLVNPTDLETVETLRSWGWHYLEGDTPRRLPLGPRRVLVLGD
ncbi:hypothetical protein [Streptomyces aureocirculatus]|uniref:hypothetical protein n=1 Tax=Streptomyces aureocirculatus TaxID=67275 RepID=UPI0004C9EED4|nr:hypothetical protein [Streptomyces aureocirculatus]